MRFHLDSDDGDMQFMACLFGVLDPLEFRAMSYEQVEGMNASSLCHHMLPDSLSHLQAFCAFCVQPFERMHLPACGMVRVSE